MIKGTDLVAKIKYEIKHNLDYSSQSVKVPVKDLEILIELAESNQYKLDMELAEAITRLSRSRCNCKDN